MGYSQSFAEGGLDSISAALTTLKAGKNGDTTYIFKVAEF